MTPAKARPVPRVPSPAQLAAHSKPTVRVPVVEEITPAHIAAAAEFGAVDGEQVVVIDGDARIPVGPASGDAPIEPYARAFIELAASVERFHARLTGTDLGPKDIDSSLAALKAQISSPSSVGNFAALRARFAIVEAEATEISQRVRAEREAARAEALAAREQIVATAEALAAKPIDKVHWKNDTAQMRELLDTWKESQRSGARVAKDAEKELWKRFTHARSSFEKARKHHFAQLDKDNSAVATAKEDLVAKAEALSTSTDWDATAREYKRLMDAWRGAGRGRKSTDDALWRRFHAAQDAFFEARKAAGDAEEAALAENVAPKEAIVKEAEALLPVTDVRAAKQALRSIQDRFEAAGQVPRADAARLTKRIGAVERAVREADQAAWTQRNPEIEARASGAAAQLHAAIADLEAQLATAKSSKDARRAKELEESLAARKAWLKQIESVVR
jgi:hypothetical protein